MVLHIYMYRYMESDPTLQSNLPFSNTHSRHIVNMSHFYETPFPSVQSWPTQGLIGGESVSGSGSISAAMPLFNEMPLWRTAVYNAVSNCATCLMLNDSLDAFNNLEILGQLIKQGESFGILSKDTLKAALTHHLSPQANVPHRQRDIETSQAISRFIQEILTNAGLTAPHETQTASSNILNDLVNKITDLTGLVFRQNATIAKMQKTLKSLAKRRSSSAACLSADNSSDSESEEGRGRRFTNNMKWNS